MKEQIKFKIIQYFTIASLYSLGVGIWAGTIYLQMRHVGFNYFQINLFLVAFWIVTFFTELPSGVFADTFGRMKTVIISSVIRAIGLIILAFDFGSIVVLLLSALLTGIGESLYSGSPDSWIVDQLKSNGAESKIPEVFSRVRTLTSILTLISGYLGANWLGKIDLKIPLVVGAALLILIVPIALAIQVNDHEQKVPLASLIKKRQPEEFDPFHNLKTNLLTGIKEVWRNKQLLWYLLAFMPIPLIVTGPYNQWQLFYPTSGKFINTGTILVGINIMGIVGSFVAQFFFKRKTKKWTVILILLTLLNTMSVIAAALLGNILLSVLFFWFHVMIAASDEVSRQSILHFQIKSSERSTIISLNNTLEAATTVIALTINGFLSDVFGIGISWAILAAIGGASSIVAYIYSIIREHDSERS